MIKHFADPTTDPATPAWEAAYKARTGDALLAAAAGLDLIVKAARSAGLPMPHTASVTGHSPLRLQFAPEDLGVWAQWCEAEVTVTPRDDGQVAHEVACDLLDVPVELVALVGAGEVGA